MSIFAKSQHPRRYVEPPALPQGTAQRPASTRHRATANDFGHYQSRSIARLAPILFGIVVLLAIAAAWAVKDEQYLTAETGLGYWLGIAGASLMALLGLYPLRKRLKFLSKTGRVANWFRFHMVIGILGPALVILHTNFKLGSLNSRLALYTMLIVVASGIAGRYLYSHIHKGLYGRQIEMREILADIEALKCNIGRGLAEDEAISNRLQTIAARAAAHKSVVTSFLTAIVSSPRAWIQRRGLAKQVRNVTRRSAQFAGAGISERRETVHLAGQQLRIFFAAVKKAERLAFFERVFGLWHHLHVPLFVLLVFTVVLHIVAVHRY